MNKQIKRFWVTVITVICIYFCFSISSFGRIEFNWRECLNETGCTSAAILKSTSETSPTLQSYVLKCSTYFMKSHAAYQEFLYFVEMSENSEIDFADIKNTLFSAIDDLENSKLAYTNLKLISEKTPYNQEMIDHLIKFDYDGFQIKKGLNDGIFERLRTVLSKGDITGLDETVLLNLNAILCKLYDLKTFIDKGSIPEIEFIWRTTQSYCEAQLFAQYMSEVFKAILF